MKRHHYNIIKMALKSKIKVSLGNAINSDTTVQRFTDFLFQQFDFEQPFNTENILA